MPSYILQLFFIVGSYVGAIWVAFDLPVWILLFIYVGVGYIGNRVEGRK